MPRFVHEPLMQWPADPRVRRKNADPFVFGAAFLYSNCRQFTLKRTPSRMQRLAPGSLALFGSTLDGCFVLDPAMVIGSAEPYVIGGPDPFGDDVPDAFRAAAPEPLAASKLNGSAPRCTEAGCMSLGGGRCSASFLPPVTAGCSRGRSSRCHVSLIRATQNLPRQHR
jgi:hypothetical protein